MAIGQVVHLDTKKTTQTTKKICIEMNGQTYKLYWTPLGSFGPKCGVNYISKLISL